MPDDDPFEPPQASPAGARPIAILALVAGLAAVVLLPPVLGPTGMVLGLVAHVKGDRLGMPATGVSAVGMIAGFALTMLLR